MKKVYDYMNNPPEAALIGTARREILNRELYNYRGVQMLDLVHASRGCSSTASPAAPASSAGRPSAPARSTR